MSMRDFLDGECGQNPVLKVASHFNRDSLTAGLGPSTSRGVDLNRQDVSHLPPTTFKMDSLLKEIQSMENYARGPIQAPAISELAAHPEWAKEFLHSEQLMRESEGPQDWVRDYISKDLELDSVWDRSHHNLVNGMGIRGVPSNEEMHAANLAYQHQHHPHQAFQDQPSAKDFLSDQNWVSQFSSNDETLLLEKTELMATAEEFLKSVSDPKIKATEFMGFVEKLSTGEIGADGRQAEARSSEWASEYEKNLTETRGDLNWSEEFVTGNGAVGGLNSSAEGKEEFWQQLNDEWEKLATEENDIHPWLSEAANKLTEPYQFSEENPFEDIEDPFAEGKRKLEAGEIPSASLLFEAAVQKEPDNPECWLLLGTTQALNEQDPSSIAALTRCLELQPQNLSALMSLAASLTNESYHLQACNTLKKWLKSNLQYSDLVNENVDGALPKITSILPTEELSKVQDLFIQAARRNLSAGLDPDVQCGLGILFNLGSDYEKAADCFQAALGANPENPLLWNRLGATLANGGKSSEAIEAYRRALEICPGFIRTRYNLGIACVNLGAYREASEHFLSSLNIQSRGKASNVKSKTSNVMSDSIWSSFRTSLHLMDLGHLTRYIDNRDLKGLNEEFNLRT